MPRALTVPRRSSSLLAVPSPVTIVAVAALGAAAATTAVECWRTAAAFDTNAIAGDPASAARAKFASLRAALPAQAAVRVVREERELDAGERAVLDLFAKALHQRLTTGANDPVPGFTQDYVQQVADGFVQRYPREQNTDPAAVRKNLEQWWTSLASGMQLYIVQYGLAPHRIRPAGTTPWVVGAFPPGYAWQPFAARHGLTLVADHGGGAVLFRAEK